MISAREVLRTMGWFMFLFIAYCIKSYLMQKLLGANDAGEGEL